MENTTSIKIIGFLLLILAALGWSFVARKILPAYLAACRNMTFARRITHAAISSEQGNSVG
jgi:hypothetical protein